MTIYARVREYSAQDKRSVTTEDLCCSASHRFCAGCLEVNGVRVDPATLSGVIDTVDSFVRCGQSHVVHFLAAHPTVEARGDVHYRELLNAGDLNVPDGLPVVWAMRLLGAKTARVTGTDAFSGIAAAALGARRRHYLYGGAPDVLRRLESSLEKANPGIKIVGAESPPFRPLTDAELRDAAERIRSAGADLVWLGLGTPKQDVVAERLRELEAAPVILCVGAAFDFVAGEKRRPPSWIQAIGLEWAARLVTDPRRLWRRYLFGNPVFIAAVAADYIRYRRAHARSVAEPPTHT